MKKTFLILGILAIGMLSLLFWPRISTTQEQIRGGDEHVILVKRKRYSIPREFHSTGGMNPINIWSYLLDPTFESNTINHHSFTSIEGAVGNLAIQGFNVNRAYDSKVFKDNIIAIRFDDDTYEYSSPNFLFSQYSRSKIHFLRQKDSTLTYFFGAVGTEKNTMPALIQIVIPFGSAPAEIVLEGAQPRWSQAISELTTAKLTPSIFIEICGDGTAMAFAFAKSLFGKSC